MPVNDDIDLHHVACAVSSCRRLRFDVINTEADFADWQKHSVPEHHSNCRHLLVDLKEMAATAELVIPMRH